MTAGSPTMCGLKDTGFSCPPPLWLSSFVFSGSSFAPSDTHMQCPCRCVPPSSLASLGVGLLPPSVRGPCSGGSDPPCVACLCTDYRVDVSKFCSRLS